MSVRPFTLVEEIGKLLSFEEIMVIGAKVELEYVRHAPDNWTDTAIVVITDSDGVVSRLKLEVSELGRLELGRLGLS